MHPAIILCEIGFILIGALFLLRALAPLKQMISNLPEGVLQQKWRVLRALILFFVVGYLLFSYNLWLIREVINPLSIVASLMLLCGGVFVFFVGQLALQTLSDVKKMALLEQESITDSLTGLKNRRYFDQRLCEEIAYSKRYRLPLSLLLIDVDYFKKVNDTYGHQVGDEVLKNLSFLIMSMVRDSDIAARYGGEEIAIIAPSTEKEEAVLLAERLREATQKATVATIQTTQEVIQVSISVGVSTLGLIVNDREAILEEADKALYEAKRLGRNRVEMSRW